MGLSEQIDIEDLIMQGTVFGSIISTIVMDKMAQMFYQNEDLIYKYKK